MPVAVNASLNIIGIVSAIKFYKLSGRKKPSMINETWLLHIVNTRILCAYF